MPPLNFEPITKRFSAVNAEALALASKLTYLEPKAARQAVASELGLDQFFAAFEHRNFAVDTQGFIAAGEQHVIMAFRGTEVRKIKDWATDVIATPGEFHWFFDHAPEVGKLHAGFANSLVDAWNVNIRELLQKAGVGTQRTLWITGHSLGAALAAVASAACVFDPKALLPVYGLYTFGQPRIGLREFCINLEKELGDVYYRFVNDRDLVPRVPPRAFDYVHMGRLIHFDPKGIPVVVGREQGKFTFPPFQTIGKVLAALKRRSELVKDHDLETGYIKNIQAASLAAPDDAGSWASALPTLW